MRDVMRILVAIALVPVVVALVLVLIAAGWIFDRGSIILTLRERRRAK